MAQWASLTPCVHQCVAELTDELSQIFEWSGIAIEEDGSFDQAAFEKAIKSWGFEPVTYLASALKRRNPARTAVAVREARAKKEAHARAAFDAPANIFDSALGNVLAKYPDKPNAANREYMLDGTGRARMPDVIASPGSGFTAQEAAEVAERLAAGASYSAGSRLVLLRCEGKQAVLTVPAPPPAKDPETALAEELAFARSRVSAAVPAVLGTEQVPLPPGPSVSREVKMPLSELPGWLEGAKWKEYALPDDFASGLHTQLLSHCFADPRHASSLLVVHEGSLDLSAFVCKSAPHEAAAAAAVHDAAEGLTEVLGLGPAMLQSDVLRAELRCADNLRRICLSPLGTGVMGPGDIAQPYRTTDYVRQRRSPRAALARGVAVRPRRTSPHFPLPSTTNSHWRRRTSTCRS